MPFPCKTREPINCSHSHWPDRADPYALTRWDGLSCFLDDGRVDLDSNTVERSIRPLALNRKNALFAGSDEGGDNWAVIATLIENCKLSGTNPHIWLTADTLARLANGHPANAVGELDTRNNHDFCAMIGLGAGMGTRCAI